MLVAASGPVISSLDDDAVRVLQTIGASRAALRAARSQQQQHGYALVGIKAGLELNSILLLPFGLSRFF